MISYQIWGLLTKRTPHGTYFFLKIFASREEMLFFGWSFEGHIWAWSRQGRGGDGALPRPSPHSAIGTRYTAPLLIQHFPKIFSYTYSVDVMCHVNNLVNMRPILPHCPGRGRPGPACCQPPPSLVEKLHYFCFIWYKIFFNGLQITWNYQKSI